jgi:hypothetical protein
MDTTYVHRSSDHLTSSYDSEHAYYLYENKSKHLNRIYANYSEHKKKHFKVIAPSDEQCYLRTNEAGP